MYFGFGLTLMAMLVAMPVQAHRVILSVWTEGEQIVGEVMFSTGAPAPPDTLIEISAPDQSPLGQTHVAQEGLFRLTPEQALDHHFFVDLGAGHVARTTLATSALPPRLGYGVSTAAADTATHALPESTAELQILLAETLRRELQPLQQRLAEYQQQTTLHLTLGAIGYIVGIFGLLFYLRARQQLKHAGPR